MGTSKNEISALIESKSGHPGKVAVQLLTGAVLTYGELISLRNQAQSALAQFKIKPCARIALVTNHSLLCIPLTLAVMESATCVPLDPELSTEQFREYYQLLSVDYLLCEPTILPAVEAAIACGIGVINFFAAPTNYSTEIKFELLNKPQLPSDQDYKNDQTAFIFTTSGTTSTPKIVPVLYRNLSDVLEIEAVGHDYTENTVQLIIVKLYRAIAIRTALRILICNGQIIYTNGLHPKRITDALFKFPVTHLSLQPAGILSLNEYLETNSIEISSSHGLTILLGGASLPPQLKNDIEKRLNARIIYGYGMTEVGRITSSSHAPQGYKPGSVGYPVSEEIKILDNEVLVKGPGVFPGYENNPEANRESFIDGWFRTGDAGYMDADGYLFLTGRIKELINRGGEKVSPYEVEEAILSLGNIKDAAVFPYPNKRGYENVGAVIVSDHGSGISLREIRAALKDKIKPYKLPTLLYKVREIPYSSAHKVQRGLLYQQLEGLGVVPESVQTSASEGEDELTSTQFIIRELWKNILDLEYVAPDDNFFEIGGDSLSAAEVLAAIETSFGCVLPVTQFFEKSTIRELANLVDDTPKYNPYKHIIPIRLGGNKIPIFFVHELSGDNVTYHHVATHIDREHPLYGLNFNWEREGWDASTNIRDVALAYVEEIQKLNENGPYYLVGLSIGGQIAFEMGSILTERQSAGVAVFMIDTFSRNYANKNAINTSIHASLTMIKQTPLWNAPKLVRKKLGTLFTVFILPELKKTSMKTVADKIKSHWNDPESANDQNQALLKLISKNHRPMHLSGKICYFRALQSQLKTNPSHAFWKSRSKEFILFETNCRHTDFVKPGLAADTAAKINTVITSRETTI